MASKKKPEFPAILEHPKLKGTTRAATPAKLAHYQALGWKVTGTDTPAAPPADSTSDTSSSPSS